MEDTAAGKVITAEVPLAEMFGYATRALDEPGPRDVHDGIREVLEVPKNVAAAVMKKAS